MSVIQYAVLCGDKILLTGDAGRDGLTEAAHYAVNSGHSVPVNKFQAPHHGGRRNLSSELLDFWVGPRLTQMVPRVKRNLRPSFHLPRKILLIHERQCYAHYDIEAHSSSRQRIRRPSCSVTVRAHGRWRRTSRIRMSKRKTEP